MAQGQGGNPNSPKGGQGQEGNKGQGGRRLIDLAFTAAGGLETLIIMGIAVAQWQAIKINFKLIN